MKGKSDEKMPMMVMMIGWIEERRVSSLKRTQEGEGDGPEGRAGEGVSGPDGWMDARCWNSRRPDEAQSEDQRGN